VPLGGYHFLTDEDIDTQLALFLSVEDVSDPTVAMAIDFEENTTGGTIDIDGVRTMVRKFNAAMKQKGYPDRYPILYGGNKIREALDRQPRDALLAKCPLWYVCLNNIGRNGSIDTSRPDIPWPIQTWPNYTIWQYDNEKRRHGSPPSSMLHPGEDPVKVLPGADWNRYAGSLDDLKKLWPFKRPLVLV
jgi:lysozyme